MYISIVQALDVWSELWQAYFGKNGYGSDTAEIYMFRLKPYTVSLDEQLITNIF